MMMDFWSGRSVKKFEMFHSRWLIIKLEGHGLSLAPQLSIVQRLDKIEQAYLQAMPKNELEKLWQKLFAY